MIDFADLSHQNIVPGIRLPDELIPLLKQEDAGPAWKWMAQHREHPLLHPHRVTLYVLENQFATDVRPVTYFIRCSRFNPELSAAQDPHARVAQVKSEMLRGFDMSAPPEPNYAAAIADTLWRRWEKPPTPEGQVPSSWPDTVDVADIIELDEGDWDEYLAAAHRYGASGQKDGNYFCVGHPRFPLYWTCTALPFEDDIELHDMEGMDLLDMFAGDPTRDTRGGVVE